MTRENAEQLTDYLRDWAGEHVERSNGLLDLLPYEPDKYPGQDGFSVEGDPQSAAVVDSIALVAQPRYADIKTRLGEQEDATGEISRVGELLKGGNNVVLVTNHGDLIDIAITQAAFYSALYEQGYEFKTGIIISKMVAFLAYRLGNELAPTVGVLKLLDNETFLSFPRTESANQRALGGLSTAAMIERHNRQMRRRIEQRLGQGSMLLAVAASGTVDKPSDTDPNTIVMGGMSSGTKKILQSNRTYALPVAVQYQGAGVVFDICDIPRTVSDDNEAARPMEEIAKTLSERVAGKQFVYNPAA